LIDWKMSTTPSVFSRSSWEWMQMKAPVRPKPSLYMCVMVYTSEYKVGYNIV